MKSKKDRLNDSFDIIIEVIKDIITNRNSVENPLNKISVKDYNKVLKNLNTLVKIINSLRFNEPFKNIKLDEIRSICLSITPFLDEKDSEDILSEVVKIHNSLCEIKKSTDRKILGEFKSSFKNLPVSIQKRINFAQKNKLGNIRYGVTSINNTKFIVENYISAKYNLRKVNFDTVEDELNESEKIELVLYGLNRIAKILRSEQYSSIDNLILNLMNKYLARYETIDNENEIEMSR